MECYISTGCISGLPIVYGDKICGIICAVKDGILTPAAPVVRGFYDDFGSLSNIIRDANVAALEQMFKINIYRILRAFERSAANDPSDDYSEISGIIVNSPNYWPHAYDTRFVMVLEHESVIKYLTEYDGELDIVFKRYDEQINDRPDVLHNIFPPESGKYSEHGLYRDDVRFPRDRFMSLYRTLNPSHIYNPDFKRPYCEAVAMFRNMIKTRMFLRIFPERYWQEPNLGFWSDMLNVFEKINKKQIGNTASDAWKENLSWCPSQCYLDVADDITLYMRWRHDDPWSFAVIRDMDGPAAGDWYYPSDTPDFTAGDYKVAEVWFEDWWSKNENKVREYFKNLDNEKTS